MQIRSIALTVSILVSASSLAANLKDGLSRSVGCQACHGADGIGFTADVPNLAGQKIPYLKAQLLAFKAGDRKHDLMNPIAKQLSDADIDNLAAFWSSLPASGSTQAAQAGALQARGSKLTFPAEFPKGFTLYRTDENAQEKSVTRFFANTLALRAAREGKSLPNGSIIVVEGASGDKTQYYSAMELRQGWGNDIPDLLRNGDWNYALFNPERIRNDKVNHAQCLACHKPAVDDEFVFTLKNLREKATAEQNSR